MIFEDLVKTTKDMQDLQRRAAIKKNKDLQEATDEKYRLLLTQINKFVATIEYLYTVAKIEKNKEIISSTIELLTLLELAVESGFAIQDNVSIAETSYKNIQGEMKKDWQKQYSNLTSSTVSTLEAIKGIDAESVSNCLRKIQPAEIWDTNVKKYQTMNTGLNEADQLIASLGLDDGIISFLQNTNAGRATLKDLDDKVLAWIRDEQLESKIRISFVKKLG
ncbi:hypothetical protein HZF24_12455 [Sedimentibacter hydroxybenzoicus DSM 7310]|uniref:Uncharacterized protein n=1 Tax=Sedimentibacter hydroxybenzoicus DSM 7310 TaxID=1123245 RepID=A0A974BLB8_SEDHY|nr:hypothetical protein [Sedimentibacter hydroxybenzoicus]NYB74951.1 hypothetical protein [Sedimentibacter hydroxybenzoicus DSM 7310]